MMAVLERIAQRYRDTRTAIAVPEWSDPAAAEPFTVYAKPFTVHQERAVSRYVSDDDPEGFARIVWDCALDADGERLFGTGDFQKFKRTAEAHVVKRIAMAIYATRGTVEDAAGN